MYLLDTNVVSELRKPKPHGAVLAWFAGVEDMQLHLSAVTIGEIQVGIELTREQPPTTWNLAAPDEYGFFANVNPHVDHPRWSQASERFIGSGGVLDVKRQPTLLFNGYADEVASLYRGMNLRENF